MKHLLHNVSTEINHQYLFDGGCIDGASAGGAGSGDSSLWTLVTLLMFIST